MVASVGETVAKVSALASRLRQLRPTMTLTRAVSSGIPAAMMLPKPITRTTIATAKPIASLRKSAVSGRASSPSAPPYSTWMPASRSGWTAASTPSRYSAPREEGLWSKRTVM